MRHFLYPFLVLLATLSASYYQLSAQVLLRAASWEYRDGELGTGVIVKPDKLWQAHDMLLVKKAHAHRRIPVNTLKWLAIGQDTIWQYCTQPGLKGYWQMLAGGDYDLYVQQRNVQINPARTGFLPVDLLIKAFGKRTDDRYVLQTDSQAVQLDFRYPEQQMAQLAVPDCKCPTQNPYFPSQRKLWRIGQALNDCMSNGTTYRHAYEGPRWEFELATPIVSPDRKIGERSRRVYGGRIGVVKPLFVLSKHLALEASFSYLLYRQTQDYAVRDAFFGGMPSFTASPINESQDANYSVQTTFHNRILGMGLRWEIAPATRFSLTLAGGAAWQFTNAFEMKGKVIEGTYAPLVPVAIQLKEPVPGGLFPYAHFGIRTPLRYDWRLSFRLRYDPVFPVITTYNQENRLVGILNYHTYRTMESAFNWTIELVLAKLVF